MRPMDDSALTDAASVLGCDVPAIRAVAEVETRGAAFLPSGRPAILYERHIFHRRTRGRHDEIAPGLSAASAGGYGAPGEAQYARLDAAMMLDRVAALEACSWGRFQVMGFNAVLCGWPDVETFVADLCNDEGAHLASFVGYVQGAGLVQALRDHDWSAFSRGYNGPDYARNGHDLKIAAAYARHAAAPGPARIRSVRDLQGALVALGFAPGPVDGVWGPRTAGALRAAFARWGVTRASVEMHPAAYEIVQAALHASGREAAR